LERQTTQWPKEKEHDKQRSAKHYTENTKDRTTRTPLKPGMSSDALEGYQGSIVKLESTLREIYGRRSNCVTNSHGYVSFVVITIIDSHCQIPCVGQGMKHT
jgi:hypothetical protein